MIPRVQSADENIGCNDPSLRSFIDVDPDSHFPIQNLPFGIFSTTERTARVGVAIGNFVVDLAVLSHKALLKTDSLDVFDQSTLNAFIAKGRKKTSNIRQAVSELLRSDNPVLRDNSELKKACIVPMAEVTMHIPVAVGGFSDFMLSKYHSLSCVEILGGKTGAVLWPNWYHMPIAYNGRASSVVVGGGDVRRPRGQVLPFGETTPRYQPTSKMDFELEAGLVIGSGNSLGSEVSIEEAEAHAFGVVLLNDWSTRDIQAWEAQPLGVFVSKGHRTAISPWVVTLDALEPFRVPGPEQLPKPLDYLVQERAGNFNVHMQASIRPHGKDHASVVCRSNLSSVYWSFAQQIAHHTSTGCNLQPGDLLGTGTVSGPSAGSQGCLYEITHDGKSTLTLDDGTERTYLEDGDQVELTAWAQADGYRIGFGTCTGRIVS